MKKFVLLIALLVVASGCHGFHGGVRGSGNVQKQKRDVGSFTSISSEGAFDIEVVSQKTPSVEIEGDDNILALVTTEVSNNVLHIKNLRHYSVSKPIALRIAVQNLEGISASGAGTIEVLGIKSEKFEIDASGAPSMKVAGETNVLNIDTSGAGNIDTHRLRASRVTVESTGVSQVEVYASQQLDATVSGPSQVIYAGDPVVNKTVHGPGSVEKKASSGA